MNPECFEYHASTVSHTSGLAFNLIS